MRNNLIFGNVPEEPNETLSQTETKVREFMASKLKLAEESVNNMKFERVHRIPSVPTRDSSGANADGRGATKPRRIVCKFTMFQDRETVRKASFNLKGSPQYVSEQFPPEVNEIRRKLFPKLKEARRNNKRAWISYDTLYVDGKPVKTG